MKNNNSIKVDPFTRTPGVAGNAFIDMHYTDEIVEAFTNENSYKYIYRIVGIRGCGKTVVYGKTLKRMQKEKNWIICPLSAAGDPTKTLIAKLAKEKLIKNKSIQTYIEANVDGETNVGALKGNVSFSASRTSNNNIIIESEEAILDEIIIKAKEKKKKILVGIDDISKTKEVVKFLSIIGKYFLEEKSSIYLLCTGLSKNIEDFSKEQNLTFFKRSNTIEIGPLNKYEIAEKYIELLNVSKDKAIELAKLVKGYAYAYQVLGSLYFSKTKESEDKIIRQFENILFKDSYDLIWKSLSTSEKEFIKTILNTSGERKIIIEKMDNKQNYSVLRERLIKKHIVNVNERGLLTIDLPRFKEYVTRWCE